MRQMRKVYIWGAIKSKETTEITLYTSDVLGYQVEIPNSEIEKRAETTLLEYLKSKVRFPSSLIGRSNIGESIILGKDAKFKDL